MNSMKMWIAGMALIAAVTASPAAAGDAEKLAAHELTALDGSKTTLSSYQGEVVVVNFWASWCTPCRKELPIMSGWHNSWAGRGAKVVAISIDKEQRKAMRFAEKENLSLNVFHDGPNGLAKTLDLPSLPCTFLLDRDGKVLAVYKSSSDEDLAELQSKVESLLNAAPAAAVKRSPMGASTAGDGGSQ